MLGSPFFPSLVLRAPIKIGIALVDAHVIFALQRALRPVLTKRQA